MLHKPVLSLSRFFKQHRPAYYEHLQAVRDRGAWEKWLAFFSRGVIAVATEAAGNGHKALESLFDRPIIAVGDVKKKTGTTYAAANSCRPIRPAASSRFW